MGPGAINYFLSHSVNQDFTQKYDMNFFFGQNIPWSLLDRSLLFSFQGNLQITLDAIRIFQKCCLPSVKKGVSIELDYTLRRKKASEANVFRRKWHHLFFTEERALHTYGTFNDNLICVLNVIWCFCSILLSIQSLKSLVLLLLLLRLCLNPPLLPLCAARIKSTIP